MQDPISPSKQSDGTRLLAKMPQVLRFIATWAAAVQGQGNLEQAAKGLMSILPISALRIKRLTENMQPRRLFTLGDCSAFPSKGLDELPNPMGSINQEEYRRRIMLARAPDQADILEFSLNRALTDAENELLALLATALAESWLLRRPGLVQRCLSEQNNRKGSSNRDEDLPILHYSNPFNLSRSEFRVCTLIGQGLTAKHIAKALGLSEATIRSHQRAIYAKTALGGQIEVMFHLQKCANSNWAAPEQTFAARA